ncbi:hypothetical protein DSM3645_05460 [Blastopirellula marina DSM 3645]|uniref:Uncharacterized protein n=1 Tax=Blastopirellula marina DSM 3645 TaxID=314230 RepID=A3ZTY4_9BACT|nr:hypothetical protein DSM3645_05460 [Blastopirellula marina DSM 3645]
MVALQLEGTLAHQAAPSISPSGSW